MITGTVVATGRQAGVVWLEPRVEINIAGLDRVFRSEEAVVDTGFTGWLTLPEATIEELGLNHYGQRLANQAGGEAEMFDIYGVLVLWHGRARPVPVHLAEGIPLIGMGLLNGSRLTVDSWEGGDVVIEECT